jgi:hypothetical protein
VHNLPLQQGAAAVPAARPGNRCIAITHAMQYSTPCMGLVPLPNLQCNQGLMVMPPDGVLMSHLHLQDLGRCRLRKNVKPAYGFDADGWQTFWQEDLFEDGA